jgi:hypothetical protein
MVGVVSRRNPVTRYDGDGDQMIETGLARAKKMGRPKGKRSERDDASVKIARALASKAKLVAAHRGIPAAELLSEMLESPIDRAYAAMLRELDTRGSAK